MALVFVLTFVAVNGEISGRNGVFSLGLMSSDTEPNNDFAHAEEIVPDSHLAGNVHLTGGDFIDYYKAQCLTGTNLEIYHVATSAGGTWYVDLYDSSETFIQEWADPSTIIFPITTSGIYYIVIGCDTLGLVNYDYYVDFVSAAPDPELSWTSPSDGATIEFDVGPTSTFNFAYTQAELDDVTLSLNGTDYGSVWGDTSIDFTFDYTTNGTIPAVLHGIQGSTEVITASRTFNFRKKTAEFTESIERNTTFVGQQLYLILHDPNGDGSYSGYEESTSLGFSVGMETSASAGVSLEVGDFAEFCGAETGASVKVSLETTATSGYDYTYTVTDKTELTSSMDSSDPNYIGPGYGDRYWGEATTLVWELNATRTNYMYETDPEYSEPKWWYGIKRDMEVVLNHLTAPAEWRSLNPYHNDWENVTWQGDIGIVGGAPHTVTHIVTETESLSQEVSIKFGVDAVGKVPGLTAEVSFELEFKVHGDTTTTNEITTSYTIDDDESIDFISQEVGIDDIFGTYIFRPYPLYSNTSGPHEFNTTDHLAPIVALPDIDLDSTGDGYYPCVDDSPLVTVDIDEEGDVAFAQLNYTINNGVSWNWIELDEQIGNPGTYYASFPSQAHETTVKWFIEVWDGEGNKAERRDEYGNLFEYTIANRAPLVTIVSPNGGESLDNIVNIMWSASDADADDLTYTVGYNFDNEGWHILEEDVTGTAYEWNVTEYGYKENVMVKVVVNDGYGGTEEDESDFSFEINPSKKVSIPGYNIGIILLSIVALASGLLWRLNRKSRKT